MALLAFAIVMTGTSVADEAKQNEGKKTTSKDQKVSYDKEIRPIFQAQCRAVTSQRRPAVGYVMTSFDLMLKGGESGDRAIVPSQPGESHLLEMITPENGKAQMPQDKPPLSLR